MTPETGSDYDRFVVAVPVRRGTVCVWGRDEDDILTDRASRIEACSMTIVCFAPFSCNLCLHALKVLL